ncbi:MAG TPA: BON domain-containing protein [Bryobacteraceae bacterium]|jgi:osmotically-inducible protein OsmY
MRILTTIAVSAAMALVGCSSTNTNANTSQNTGQSNSDLEQSIKNKLAADPKTADTKLDVSANSDKNQITLSGTVYSEEARTQAVNDAKDAKPGADVVDKIDVKPGEIPKSAYTEDMARQTRDAAKATGDRLGTSLDDAWIHTKIASKLIADTNTPSRKINIDVVNGMVTLRGTVDSPEAKAEASHVAMDTDGVKKVNNQLRVRAG